MAGFNMLRRVAWQKSTKVSEKSIACIYYKDLGRNIRNVGKFIP
jgi:hypothetical protein